MTDRRKGHIARELLLRTFFGGAVEPSPWLLSRMSSLLEEGEVREGDVLFAEGQTSDRIYFVENGLFRLTRAGAAPFRYEGRWLIGAADVMLGRPRRRTATALRTTSLLSARGSDWLDALDDTFDTAREVLLERSRAAARLYERVTDPFPPPPPLTTPPDRPLGLVDRMHVLVHSGMVQRAGAQTLAILAESARELRLAPGELLLAREAPRDRVFVVAHGAIETSQPARFGRGGFVGGAALHAGGWEARAAAPSVVLAVPTEDWLETLEEHFDLVRSVMGFNDLERERIFEMLAEQEPEATFR